MTYSVVQHRGSKCEARKQPRQQEGTTVSFFEDHRPSDDSEVTVLLDHGSRTVDELNADTIRLALNYGWNGEDEEEDVFVRALVGDEDERPWWESTVRAARAVREDEFAFSQELTELADAAIDYLNELVPDGWAVYNDGELGALILEVTEV